MESLLKKINLNDILWQNKERKNISIFIFQI